MLQTGLAAGRLGVCLAVRCDDQGAEVRIALDGDAVIFASESDQIFRVQGLEAFRRHERDNATKPMRKGSFGDLPAKLVAVRSARLDKGGPGGVRLAVVTWRSAAAHARVIHTLRSLGNGGGRGPLRRRPRQSATAFRLRRAHLLRRSGKPCRGRFARGMRRARPLRDVRLLGDARVSHAGDICEESVERAVASRLSGTINFVSGYPQRRT